MLISLPSSTAFCQEINVVVSIPPQKYFVQKIGGEFVEVMTMVHPGANPATYEPKPSQISKLSHSQVYFAIGVPFEKHWLDKFSSINKDIRIVKTQLGIAKRDMDTYNIVHQSSENSQNVIRDPHIWLSPSLVRIMAANIKEALIQIDPEHKSSYRQNFINFAKEINKLDMKILKLFSEATLKDKFLVYHPSWGYFAREYGLKQISIQIEGKQPSPRELSAIINNVKKTKINKIFVQPQFSKKSAKMIAENINASNLSIDPLAQDWASNLYQTAKSIKSGLY